MVSRPELAAPRNKWKPTPTYFGYERRVRRGGKDDADLVYDCFCASISPRKIHPQRDYLIAESC